MEIKEIINEVIAGITVLAIASLIGFIFKGRFVSVFNHFVNYKNSKVGAFFGYIFIVLIVVIPVAVIESLNINSSLKTVIFTFYIYALLFYFRFVVIDTGEFSFTSIKAALNEKSYWLGKFGKLEFMCNVDDVSIAFYSVDSKIYFVPVDSKTIDIDRWIDVNRKISPIVNHAKSIEDVKSALGCNSHS